MHNPTFSIIVPTYNRAHLIGRTLQSLLDQDFDDFEIIVVDDGSTDNTEEVVKTFNDSRIQYFKKKNEERAAARNFGCQKSTGLFVNFFDSDDLAYSNHTAEAKKVIEEHTDYQVFHLNYDFRDENYSKISRFGQMNDVVNEDLIKGNVLSCNGVFIKRETATENPFNADRDLSASEDYLLWLQLASKYQIHHISTITSSIVEHDARSVMNVNLNGLKKRKMLMLKYLFEDERSSKFYSGHKNLIHSNAHSYIALHGALAKNINNKDTIKHLFKSLKFYPLSFFNRRTFAIFKHLILR